MKRLFIVFLVFVGLSLSLGVNATTYVVNSPDGDNDGTCVHPYVDVNSDCTLAEAIVATNANGGPDNINIGFDGSFAPINNQYTITPTATFTITDPVEINASGTWDGANKRPGVIIKTASTAFDAFIFNSGSVGSELKGFEIDGFRSGIMINDSNIIIGNDCDGSSDNTEGNVVHGGTEYGISIVGSGVTVAGNVLGLDDDGLTVDRFGYDSVRINGASSDNNTIGFKEGSTGSCTAMSQRNLISNPGTNYRAGIRLQGTGIENYNGDTALGPDGNTIAGNWIGVDKTGTRATHSSAIAYGIYVINNATNNIIGTDGDGIDDVLERNLISGKSTGIFVLRTGHNRMSGNYFGTTDTGNAVLTDSQFGRAISTRGHGNIIGWCDTTVNATLCSDAGNASNQRNVMGGSEASAMLISFGSEDTYIYGNNVGVGADGNSIIGNGFVWNEGGIRLNRALTNVNVGGSGSKANIIKNNYYGIQVSGQGIFPVHRGDPIFQVPIAGTISGNIITNNTSSGVYIEHNNLFVADTSTSHLIFSDNEISNNGGHGFEIIGSSFGISNNKIKGNGDFGIFFRPTFMQAGTAGEPYLTGNVFDENYSPAYAADNLESFPSITGNTIAGNSSGGIYQLDSRASNYATLYSDNTFGNNKGNPAIFQAWYGVVEILDRVGNPIVSGAGTTTAALSSQAGSVQQSAANNMTAGGDYVFGPTGVDYTNASTWFTMFEYVINTGGDKTTYNNYSVSASGTHTANTSTFSFDGTDNDTNFPGALLNCIANDGLCRYQIAKVKTSS
ncbi:MAG: right-handed parallel beta-helix repeat-containing protein, partial [bacterium]|nr:right-handed parallel beta-helix repeat-containing protein [bacterium]